MIDLIIREGNHEDLEVFVLPPIFMTQIGRDWDVFTAVSRPIFLTQIWSFVLVSKGEGLPVECIG